MRRNHLLGLGTVVLCLMTLIACGGGGGSKGPSIDSPTAPTNPPQSQSAGSCTGATENCIDIMAVRYQGKDLCGGTYPFSNGQGQPIEVTVGYHADQTFAPIIHGYLETGLGNGGTSFRFLEAGEGVTVANFRPQERGLFVELEGRLRDDPGNWISEPDMEPCVIDVR